MLRYFLVALVWGIGFGIPSSATDEGMVLGTEPSADSERDNQGDLIQTNVSSDVALHGIREALEDAAAWIPPELSVQIRIAAERFTSELPSLYPLRQARGSSRLSASRTFHKSIPADSYLHWRDYALLFLGVTLDEASDATKPLGVSEITLPLSFVEGCHPGGVSVLREVLILLSTVPTLFDDVVTQTLMHKEVIDTELLNAIKTGYAAARKATKEGARNPFAELIADPESSVALESVVKQCGFPNTAEGVRISSVVRAMYLLGHGDALSALERHVVEALSLVQKEERQSEAQGWLEVSVTWSSLELWRSGRPKALVLSFKAYTHQTRSCVLLASALLPVIATEKARLLVPSAGQAASEEDLPDGYLQDVLTLMESVSNGDLIWSSVLRCYVPKVVK